MNISILAEKCGLKVLNLSNHDAEISGVYCCDLLSVVMSRAFSGCAWVTVMGNINSIGVAALADIGCIVLSDTAALDENALAKAKIQQINILKSDKPIFETALAINEAIKNA